MTLPATHQLVRADGSVLRYCLYGPADGHPVISHGGTPSSRWRRPRLVDAMERGPLRVLAYDRPGYGGSTRRFGRTVADVADDTRSLADAYGWAQFGVLGGSGGGPHALACAALLADRVTRCAVVSGIRPAEPGTPPRDEADERVQLAETAAAILANVADGGPEAPDEPEPFARDNPDAMARLRATFVDDIDGWIDDRLAFVQPWGFALEAIGVPVGIWRGTDDPFVPADHAEYLLAHIPGAADHVFTGGHLPGPDVYAEIFAWLAAPSVH
ncbi:alpha/beta fold hydrolase [Hamadaea tsunoensis]|uniref:alpha/beta fold hydrolase n=1 Tax=Hamadaea tsunoensis TaxID=53368 RepID=UPI00041E5634|nr:alpha/beta hydrolase [Hamadaea tsunoensis]